MRDDREEEWSKRRTRKILKRGKKSKYNGREGEKKIKRKKE